MQLGCILSAPDRAMGCLAQRCQCVHLCIGLAHTEHSLKSVGTNGQRSKTQGKGCQQTVTSSSAPAPPPLQAASQRCLHCLELCVTWHNGIAWGPQLWALPCPMLPVAVCELCTQTTPRRPFTGMTKHKIGNQFGPK